LVHENTPTKTFDEENVLKNYKTFVNDECTSAERMFLLMFCKMKERPH
jgi:hypothetical protein